MPINPKQLLFETLASLGKALSNSHRLELLDFLAQGERTVERLATLAGLSVANTSQHLRILHRAGLVTTRKESQNVHYALADQSIVALMGEMRKVSETTMAEMERLINTYLKTRDALSPVTADELIGMLDRDAVTVIDVRPPEEYAQGHIPGAINIPFRELESRADELRGDREIVAYCRGPYCLLSYDAVVLFRSLGQPARRLEDGFPEWRYGHHPVEKTE